MTGQDKLFRHSLKGSSWYPQIKKKNWVCLKQFPGTPVSGNSSRSQRYRLLFKRFSVQFLTTGDHLSCHLTSPSLFKNVRLLGWMCMPLLGRLREMNYKFEAWPGDLMRHYLKIKRAWHEAQHSLVQSLDWGNGSLLFFEGIFQSSQKGW